MPWLAWVTRQIQENKKSRGGNLPGCIHRDQLSWALPRPWWPAVSGRCDTASSLSALFPPWSVPPPKGAGFPTRTRTRLSRPEAPRNPLCLRFPSFRICREPPGAWGRWMFEPSSRICPREKAWYDNMDCSSGFLLFKKDIFLKPYLMTVKTWLQRNLPHGRPVGKS